MITDSQIHLWEANRRDRPWTAISEPNLPEPYGPERFLSVLDRAGVDRAVIVPPGFMGTNNEYGLECAARHPTRLAVMGLINPAAPDAPEQVAGWLSQPGMIGIRTHVHARLRAFWGSDEAADPFWAACERHDVPVAVFSTGAKDYVERVVRRHPGLRLIIDHMGLPVAEALAGARGDGVESLDHPEIRQMLALARYPRVAVKVSTKPPFDRSPTGIELVRRVVEAYGPERLFWGTDYTQALRIGYERYEEQVDVIRVAADFLGDDDRKWILGRALAEYLHWPDGAESTALARRR
ncbi:MAG: amidohydrolase family protein [Chloroflexi bacterium]|nr:amidohydrolase family protein [Chloroflexota bacterium]